MKQCRGKVCIPFRKDALTLFCPWDIISEWWHDIVSLCSCMQGKEASRRQGSVSKFLYTTLLHPALKRWGLKFLRRSICKQLLKEMSSLQHCDLNGNGNYSKTFLRLFFCHHWSFSLPVHKSILPCEGREEHSALSDLVVWGMNSGWKELVLLYD